VDVSEYKIITSTTPIPATQINSHAHTSTSQSVCNCQNINWGYSIASPDGESLDSWATVKIHALLNDPKRIASFSSHPYNLGTDPDLAFASVGHNSRLLDRRFLETFPRSQYRPPLITSYQKRFSQIIGFQYLRNPDGQNRWKFQISGNKQKINLEPNSPWFPLAQTKPLYDCLLLLTNTPSQFPVLSKTN